MLESFDKEYLKNVVLKILGFILCALLIVYIGYQMWRKMTSSMEFETAAPYTVSIKSSGTGYIFRTSEPLSPASGSVVPSVSVGEKVSVGSEVARVYSDAHSSTVSELHELSRRINLLSSMANGGELSTKDVSKLDSEVYSLMTDISRSVAAGRYNEAVSRRIDLLTKINKRGLASGMASAQSSQLNALISEREELIARLGEARSIVGASRAGWYYPECDGYESIFDASQIDFLTYEKFVGAISSPPNSPSNTGKIVTENRWYFAFETTSDDIKKKTLGEEYTLFFPYNGNQKVTMTLYSAQLGSNGMGVAVFCSDEIPANFDFASMQTYELLEEEYTGFKVPKNAVRVIDGEMGVYVLSGETVHFRKIDVLTDYENSYIVAMTHEEQKEEEPVETNEIGEPIEPETAPLETESEPTDSEESRYEWLGLNESIIVKGKGLRDGRIITSAS